MTGGGQRNRGTESPKKQSSDEEGEGKVKATEGLTPHPCQGSLTAPHASVSLGRMPQPETDAGQKGAVVYRYVPSLPLSLHRRAVHPTGDVPLPASVAAWLIRMSRREEKGGQVDCGRRWVRAQQAVQRGCAFPCDLFFFFPSCTRCCLACA